MLEYLPADKEEDDDNDEPDQVCTYIYSANELSITQHGTVSMMEPLPSQHPSLPPQQPPVPHWPLGVRTKSRLAGSHYKAKQTSSRHLEFNISVCI